VALNSNGSVIPETGKAATSSLFRDSDGCWVSAYAINLWICLIICAELRAVVNGLQLAWDSTNKQVRVQLDSQATIQFLLAEGESTHQQSSEVANSISCWIKTGRQKLSIFIRKATRQQTY
ncbi:hypothetical protein LINGRAHAP2_LOCUS23077, partial [Linum grandiflorum]